MGVSRAVFLAAYPGRALLGLMSSPIMPASLLCALVCCVCGYVAFRVLHAREQRQASLSELTARKLPDLGGAEQITGELLRHTVPGKDRTPAPDTPTASPQAPPKPTFDSEDGNSSVLIERVSSGQLEVPGVLRTGGSLRVIGSDPAERRGPLTAEVPEGEHNYVWDDGSEFFGEWKGGLAQGRGVFSWPSGDRYEGEWEDGLENGVGTYISSDGSTFYGFWLDGKMHGEGVYKPATADNQRAEVMFMREYDHGKLVKETVLRVKDYDLHRKELKRDQRARRVEKKQAAKELAHPRPGETIYKGHRSYDLMRNLQMGILFSIAKTNREVSERDAEPRPADYRTEVSQQFPRSGQSTSFKWKDYCPHIFHRLRQAFGIDNRDYLLSLTGDKALRELPSPGKSGSVFFISDDDRFMIKTVRKEEMRLLLELVPKYYHHCLDNPDTLLTRFYGVHRVKPINGHHVRFLVMGNVFPTETTLHRKYDLKGSTYGRTAGPKRTEPGATLKDLDVDFRLQLKETYYRQLMAQIEADAALLERMHVMDYSLLLGIHYVAGEDAFLEPLVPADVRDAAGLPPGPQPSAAWGERHPASWSAGCAAAERDARRSTSPERAIFNRWHSEKQLLPDEPAGPLTSEEAAAGRAMASPPPNSELEVSSAASSMTSTSVVSLGGTLSFRKGSLEELQVQLKSSLGIRRPSGSWPTASPSRPSRFAPDIRSAGVARAPPPQSGSPFASSARRDELPPLPAGREEEVAGSGPVRPGQTDAERPAGLLHLLHRVRIREDPEPGGAKSGLDRTRSGWLKGGQEGTSLRSLHSEARQHMGVSIPAMVHPLAPAGHPDLAQPVTLFFGIIDFLQDYNMRKRTEHVLKSIVQDGKAISVTSPHVYSQRFIRYMRDLFVTAESEAR